LLAHEIRAQTYPSGATREQAFGYHLFVLQFFLVAGVVSRWSQHGFDAAYWEQLHRMFAFAAAMTDGGPPPSFGDGDDGYVLDLGNGPREVDALMNVGRRLFGASGLREAPAEAAETAFWLFGGPARSARVPSAPRPAPPALESVSFADAGWYLLQWGTAGSLDRVSVLFDCGELGFTSLAAHGHADALNFTVRAFGEDLLVDPGTYDYFSYPEWREYFRSTRAHNTATVDGLDQSELLGSFLWGRRAEARCREWTPRPGGGAVSGEHDGYSKLDDPVICRRRLELDQKPRTLVIDDEIVARGRHHIALFFHLSSACDVTREGNRIDIDFPRGRAVLQIDDRLVVSVARAGTPREGGWVSSGYHRKAAAWTLAATCVNEGTGHLRSVLTIGTPR
jgi:hypothetical protein